MFSGRDAINTFTKQNIALWLTLAFQGGILNAGGYLAFGRFVSHVTGLATMIGIEAGTSGVGAAAALMIVLVSFLFGAMLSGFLVDSRLRENQPAKYYVVFGWIFILLLAFVVGGFNGFFGPFRDPTLALDTAKNEQLIGLGWLCLVCGMQNGLITRASKAVIRTTHMTGLTTDLGLSLVRIMRPPQGTARSPDEVRATLVRIGLICSFIAGAGVGGSVFLLAGFRGFLLPTVISGGLFFLATYFQVLRRKPANP